MPPEAGEPPPDRGLKFRIAMWTTIVVLSAGIFLFARFILRLVWP
jgi:hypothetical protein